MSDTTHLPAPQQEELLLHIYTPATQLPPPAAGAVQLSLLLPAIMAALPASERNWGLAWYQLLQTVLDPAAIDALDSSMAAGVSILQYTRQTPMLLHDCCEAIQTLLPPIPRLRGPALPATLEDPTAADPQLICMTQNLCALQSHAQSTFDLNIECRPALFLGQEHKLPPRKHKAQWLRRAFPDTALRISCCPTTAAGSLPQPRPRAGTLAAVHTALLRRGVTETCVPTPPNLQGYLTHVKLHALGGTPRHCLSLYLPINDRRQATVALVTAYIQDCQQKHPGDRFLIGGDLNGVTAPADRSAGQLTPADAQLISMMAECNLVSVFSGGADPRPHTFHSAAASARLDDFLCGPDDPLIAELAASPQMQTWRSAAAHHSDHLPVWFSARASVLLGAPLPSPLVPRADAPPPAHPTFVRPFPKDCLADFTQQASAHCGDRALAAATAIQHALSAQPSAALDPDTRNALLAEAEACLHAAYEIAFQVLPTKRLPPPAQPAPPSPAQRYFMNRSRARQHQLHLKHVIACRKMNRQLTRVQRGTATWQQLLDSSCAAQIAADPDLVTAIPVPCATAAEDPDTIPLYTSLVGECLTEHGAHLRRLTREHIAAGLQRERERFTKLYFTSPKKATKQIFTDVTNTGSMQNSMPAMQHPTQGLLSDPAAIVDAVHYHHRSVASPKVPKHTADQLPWEQNDAPDRYVMQRRGEPGTALLPKLTATTFRGCLRGLSNSTAAGHADGIPNEVLKHLPPELEGLLHKMLQLYWHTGHTPAARLQSTTLLFLKRPPAHCPANYRPIAIHETLLKLYTRLITQVLSDYAEQHGVFTHAQEGFRPGRGTADLLQYFTLVLEDARRHKNNLFVTKLDWQQAFNSMEHSRLYVVMASLGFPPDAIAAVRGIYAGATTVVQTPHGPTPPINIRRGVIQGDTLSPLLFIILLEPLLRWLEGGNRGYALGSVHQHIGIGCVPAHHRRAAAGAYADDVAIFAGDELSMQVQLDKISRFSAWSGMFLNANKCEASAVLHAEPRPAAPRTITGKLQGLRVCGEQLKTVQPTAPFKYLGVTFTLTLDWSHQRAQASALLEQRVSQLSAAPASPDTQLCIERQSILGALRHSFPVAPYSLSHLTAFDATRARAVRTAYRVPKNFPTDAIYASRDNFGMGHPSVICEYVSAVQKHMFDALNDRGRLGTLARSMLHSTLHPAQPEPPSPTAGSQPNGSLFAELFSSPSQGGAAARQPPEALDAASLWDAPPLTSGCRQKYMLDRMHQWLIDWHFLTRLNTTAGPHQTTPHDLWETLHDANRAHGRSCTAPDMLRLMAVPMWQLGARTLSDLLDPDTHCILTPPQFSAKYPQADDDAHAALERITDLVCTLPGVDLASRDRRVPPHLHPHTSGPPAPSGKLRHLQVFGCAGSRDTAAGPEYLVSWAPSWALTTPVFEELQRLGCTPAAVTASAVHPACSDVHWHDSWESTATLQLPDAIGHHLLQTALSDSAHHQQPIDTKAAIPPVPLPADRFHVDFDEVNPDVDTTSLLAPTVVVDAGKAWCFTRAGRCTAALPPELLHLLHLDYQATDNAHQTLAGFQAALVALTQEHFPRYTTKLPPKPCPTDSYSLPPALLQALQLACSLQVQWDTNPLTRHRSLPRCTTAKPLDQPFNCNTSQHRCRFSGYAGLLLTPETEEAAATALKWAILSTYCAEPTLTALVLPSMPSRGYTRYMQHSRVHRLCTLPSATGEDGPGLHINRLQPTGDVTTRRAKWDADLVLVANAAGIEQYWQQRAAPQLVAALRQAWGAAATPDTNIAGWQRSVHQAGDVGQPAAPTSFIKATVLPPATGRLVPPAAPCPDTVQLLTGPRDLRFSHGALVFTDGSKSTGGALGCGVYSELTDECHSTKPEGHNLQLNTVPSAELIAMLLGTDSHPPTSDLNLFVDSSTAMWLTHMAIHRPERTRLKKHKGILTHLVAAISCRTILHGSKVSIFKVRSHIGVAGNEQADAAAKEATCDPDCELYDDALAGDPGLGASWPLVLAKPGTRDDDEPYWLADTLAAPKRQVARVHQNGIRHKTTSKMLRLLFDQLSLPGSPGLLRESALAIWSQQFTFRQRRLALLLRFDQHYFGKHLHRVAPAKHTGDCSLCPAGDVENQAHALGSCLHAQTHAMICLRHGTAVHMIREALITAVNFPVIADAEGHGAFRQPPWLLPEAAVASRPDLLTVIDLADPPPAQVDRTRHTVMPVPPACCTYWPAAGHSGTNALA